MSDAIPVHTIEKRVILDLFDVQSPISAGDKPVAQVDGAGLNSTGNSGPKAGCTHRRTMSSASRLRWTSSGITR